MFIKGHYDLPATPGVWESIQVPAEDEAGAEVAAAGSDNRAPV